MHRKSERRRGRCPRCGGAATATRLGLPVFQGPAQGSAPLVASEL